MEIERVKSITWGSEINEDVFRRWAQGFSFSTSEPLSLVQYSGGPCAVLAPVQAFILQKHLFDSGLAETDRDSENWRKCTDTDSKELLLRALYEILKSASTNEGRCKVVYLEDKSLNTSALCMSNEETVAVVSSKPSPQRNKRPKNSPTAERKGEKEREGRLKRKYPYSSDEDCRDDDDVSCRKKESVVPQTMDFDVPFLNMAVGTSNTTASSTPSLEGSNIISAVGSIASGVLSRPNKESSELISKEYLSSVLASLQQQRTSDKSAGSEPGMDSSEVSLHTLSTALRSVTVPSDLLTRRPLHAFSSSSSSGGGPVTRHSVNTVTNTRTLSTTAQPTHHTVHSSHPIVHSSPTVSSKHVSSPSSSSTAPPPPPQQQLVTSRSSQPQQTPSDDNKRKSKPFLGTFNNFHLNVKVIECHDEETVFDLFRANIDDLEGPFGVILFLYSVIFTKGIDVLMEEREEKEQPLIDPVHGHGSQSLINLLLVGCAVTNVFDLDKDLGGIKLRGIPHQSKVGFLTLLEALRYCQVGSYLKTPVYPVWLIGSETHLTVLFSTESGLISVPDPQVDARREFSKFDTEGIGMIETKLLGELLDNLRIEHNPEFVLMLEEKLDDEHSGVILLSDFLEEFFPKMDLDPPKAFPVYHYNGLRHSTEPGKVEFSRGNAVILDEVGGTNSDCTLINCLHTKWPSLIIHWDNQVDPKII